MELLDYSIENLVNEFTKDRKILLHGEINEALALKVILIINKLQKESNKPIYMFIDSPGGSLQAGLSIIDTMEYSKVPIYTFCYSLAASMAAVILSAGDKRFAYKHSTVMIHQPLMGTEGYTKQSDLSIAAKKLENQRKKIEELLTGYTKGKTSLKKMHKACDFDNYLTSEEALNMGLIDEIVKGSK